MFKEFGLEMWIMVMFVFFVFDDKVYMVLLFLLKSMLLVFGVV